MTAVPTNTPQPGTMPGTHNVFAITKFLIQHMEELFRMFEIVLYSNDMFKNDQVV